LDKIRILLSGKFYISVATLLIIVLASILRTAHLSAESVDGDEVFSRRLALADTARTWTLARQDLVHPPLYYFLLKATIPSGDTSTASDIRRLSLISGAIGTVVVILIGFAAPEIRVSALLAALLLALNRVHIFYSQQARSFALYTALVALLLLWKAVADRFWQRPWYWVSGTILMSAITWTHYTGVLFCTACVLPTTLTSDNGTFGGARRLLPLMALAVSALLFLPWLIPEMPALLQKDRIAESSGWQGLPTAFDLKLAFADYVGIPHVRGATTVVFLVGAFLLCCAFLPRGATEPAVGAGIKLTLAIMAVAPPVFLWLATRPPLQLPVFAERHVLPAIVPALILMCHGLTRLAYLVGNSLRGGLVFGLGALMLCGLETAPVYADGPGPIRNPYAAVAHDLQRSGFHLPVYTTWPYGIGEPVRFYLPAGNRTIYEFPKSEGDAPLPPRFIVLYRPAVAKENAMIQPLMHQYDIVTSNYYGGIGSIYKTRLLVLSRREDLEK
jgi:hypothetical protein